MVKHGWIIPLFAFWEIKLLFPAFSFNFNSRSIKPPLKLRNLWVITFNNFMHLWNDTHYRKYIRRTKFQKWNVSRLVLQLLLPSIWSQVLIREWSFLVGAALKGNASTASEWSTKLLPSKLRPMSIRCFTVLMYVQNPVPIYIFVIEKDPWVIGKVWLSTCDKSLAQQQHTRQQSFKTDTKICKMN